MSCVHTDCEGYRGCGRRILFDRRAVRGGRRSDRARHLHGKYRGGARGEYRR